MLYATMRVFLIILLLSFASTSYCQKNEIYRLTFSDTSNFRITTYLDHKKPKKLFIIDTTQKWLSARFWLDELNSATSEKIKDMERDEHHPYNYAYLFRDTILDSLIPVNERKSLSQKSALLKSKKIALNGKNYRTVSSSRNIKGFYFVTSEPVFTSDEKYAFIDIVVFYKDRLRQDLNDTYFGTLCIVYEKQQDNSWKRINWTSRLIL
jgi:hypothetical protein